MFQTYFFLQAKILSRKLDGLHIKPFVSIVVILVLFIISTELIFQKSYGAYLNCFLCLILLSTFSKTRRIKFLLSIFQNKHFYQLRLIENFLLAFPFLISLTCHRFYTLSFILIGWVCLLVFSKKEISLNLKIPSPFQRHPYEFTIGFRRFFLLILGVYILQLPAFVYFNQNLSYFSLFILNLIFFQFYAEPEPDFFVWTYHNSPRQFLTKKLKGAFSNQLILSAPLTLSISIYFSNFFIPIIIHLVGLLLVSLGVVMKYKNYPNTSTLTDAISHVIVTGKQIGRAHV